VAVYLKAGKKTVHWLAQRGDTGIQAGRDLAVSSQRMDRWIAAQIAEKTQDKT
jgi:hypothetical protein